MARIALMTRTMRRDQKRLSVYVDDSPKPVVAESEE